MEFSLDVNAEVAKLKEVFEFGFITQGEYEDRLRALGVEIPSESNASGQINGDTIDSPQLNTDYNSTAYSSGYTQDYSLSSTAYDTDAYSSHANFKSAYGTANDVGETNFDISNFNNDTYSHSNSFALHDSDESTSAYSTHDITSHDIAVHDEPYGSNYCKNKCHANNSHENDYRENHDPVTPDTSHPQQYNDIDHSGEKREDNINKHTTQFANYPQKIFKAAPPPPNYLRTDTERYLCGSYYYHPSTDGVVVYKRNVRGLFQTAPLTNPTLESILSDFGITYGKLLKLFSPKDDEPSQDLYVPEYDLSAIVPPGHYMLVQGSSMIERGSWQARSDRAPWQHSFSYYDEIAFKSWILDISHKLSRSWGYDEQSNGGFVRKPLKWLFLGENNDSFFISHFFLRLRTQEAKWVASHTTRAIQKLRQCEQEHLCYFCGAGDCATNLPFCSNHTDDLLNKLFEHVHQSENIWEKQTSTGGDDLDCQEKEQEEQERKVAQKAYEGFISKKEQYRYLDPTTPSVQKIFSRCMDRNL
eukprot:Phypoly_transcript_07089.p1 GENE.Phypoly_transcript_07089~~Phypoly_transcript_07089.p1  ORF type:complete len:539 (+),score=56.07 Phypoly_transcript_07089:28-1617(+)